MRAVVARPAVWCGTNRDPPGMIGISRLRSVARETRAHRKATWHDTTSASLARCARCRSVKALMPATCRSRASFVSGRPHRNPSRKQHLWRLATSRSCRSWRARYNRGSAARASRPTRQRSANAALSRAGMLPNCASPQHIQRKGQRLPPPALTPPVHQALIGGVTTTLFLSSTAYEQRPSHHRPRRRHRS